MQGKYHFKCLRCNVDFRAKKEYGPDKCPNCQSPKWDVPFGFRSGLGMMAAKGTTKPSKDVGIVIGNKKYGRRSPFSKGGRKV